MPKTPTIQLPDLKADQTRPEAIAMIAVAAWGVGFVVMLGVARLVPHETSDATGGRAATVTVVQAARAQLPGAEAEPTRAVSTTRGLEEPDETHTVRPGPAVEVIAEPTPVLSKGEVVAEEGVAVAVNDQVNVNEREREVAALPEPSIAAKPVAAPTSAAITKPLPAAPAIAPLAAASDGDPSAAKAATNVAKKHATKREFKKGVFAYLRCEGSERPHARFPCPRDPKLEEQVWRTLETLPMCDSDPGAGTAELRLVLRKSQIQSIEWKPIAADPGLNLRAVGKCAGSKLSGLTTRLKAPEGLVSFRFSLE